jgi:predicted dinucleotide-binding enzyme
MRELERDPLPSPLNAPLAVIGRGRVGRSLARAAEPAGVDVRLAGREDAAEACRGAGAVLLCVPDDQIGTAAERIAADAPPLVGHVSGASTLEAPAPALQGTGGSSDSPRVALSRALGSSEPPRVSAVFSMHPLQTFADGETPVEGTPAAIAGSGAKSLAYARALAESLGMRPFEVPEESRAAYHAAASIASNLLIALEESASELLERIGVADARELLAPLVLRTAANWSERGGGALTGPIARGDRETVERHRAALAEAAPELLAVYDALAERAGAVAGRAARDAEHLEGARA